MEIMDRINQLTKERQELFRQASNGRRGDPGVMLRVKQLDQELERLWDLRRKERIGKLEGIDAVIDNVYRQTYGPRYEEGFRPTPVEEPSNEPVKVAA